MITSEGYDVEKLKDIGIKSVSLPVQHQVLVHERLARSHVDARINTVKNNEPLDWATAEAMAFGSLLLEGFVLLLLLCFACNGIVFSNNVRISGQDVGRGTFSQRHLMIVDQNSDVYYVPLNFLSSEQGHLEVANSFLSELAVVGFEYGFSCDNPHNLVGSSCLLPQR